MPTYDYRCEACGHRIEVFQSITEGPKRKCPACGRTRLKRMLGTGAGILFKGSGFYQTDYRSDSYRKAAEAERKSGEPKDAGPDSKKGGDAKPKKGGSAEAAS